MSYLCLRARANGQHEDDDAARVKCSYVYLQLFGVVKAIITTDVLFIDGI